MEWIFKAQSFLLNSSPALYPALACVYSFISSPHCSVMCSPLLPFQNKERYFVGRLISYTFLGGVFGGFGAFFKNALEFKALAALGFVVFFIASLLIVFSSFFALRSSWKLNLNRFQKPFLRGSLTGFLPCHLLYFFYSLAVLSGSVLGGALILFVHATLSLPALAYGRRWLEKLPRFFKSKDWVVKLMIVGLSLLNLLYFASRLFVSDAEAKSKFLFCF